MLSVALIGLVTTPRTFTSQTALERQAHRIPANHPIATSRISQYYKTRTAIARRMGAAVKFQSRARYIQRSKSQSSRICNSPPQHSRTIYVDRAFYHYLLRGHAYPIGLPVKLPIGQSRAAFAPDNWLEIEGETIVEELQGKRKLIIQASSLKPIPEPKNPYDY